MSSDEEDPFSTEAVDMVLWLLMMNTVREEVREMDKPHLVLCHDPVTDSVAYQGPFPTGLVALQYAEEESRQAAAAGADLSGLTYSVAPIRDPLHLGRADHDAQGK